MDHICYTFPGTLDKVGETYFSDLQKYKMLEFKLWKDESHVTVAQSLLM